MTRNYLAFDIETAKVIPGQVSDLKAHRPLGIACAATYSSVDEKPRLWHGRKDDRTPAERMSREEAAELVDFLVAEAAKGATILTWNGLHFDFDILAEESGKSAECKRLAAGHVDMMFHAFCLLGFPIALQAALDGMGLPGKSASVPQQLVPQFWKDGKTSEVLDYVSQDVRATLELARLCEKKRALRWVARSGKVRDVRLGPSWLAVDAALRLPKPDTSWMDDPLDRARFTAWW